jgi:hypothetical protein
MDEQDLTPIPTGLPPGEAPEARRFLSKVEELHDSLRKIANGGMVIGLTTGALTWAALPVIPRVMQAVLGIVAVNAAVFTHFAKSGIGEAMRAVKRAVAGETAPEEMKDLHAKSLKRGNRASAGAFALWLTGFGLVAAHPDPKSKLCALGLAATFAAVAVHAEAARGRSLAGGLRAADRVARETRFSGFSLK